MSELLTIAEVVEEFRVSRALVYAAILAGELPASPKPYRVRKADAAAWRAISRQAATDTKEVEALKAVALAALMPRTVSPRILPKGGPSTLRGRKRQGASTAQKSSQG